MFSRFGERGDVAAPNHCKWCGRLLRKKWRNEYPPTVLTWFEGTQHQKGHASATTVIKTVKVGNPEFGDYGDGHFCGLRCGYDFAVWFANNGHHIVLKKTKEAK